jgi:hypothetical protein
MHGWRDASTAVIAARIAAEVPDIKLVALLRDPIARARSQHAMAVTRGVETRDFNAAVADLLHERGLREGRLAADDTNTYVVQGEYGRILGDYRAYFAPEQLYVRFTSELATDPEAVLRGVFEFLGVDSNFAPPSLGQRSFAGGKRPRADPAAVEQLVAEISATPPGARSHHTRGWVNGRRIDAPGVTELIAAVARVESPPAPLSDELRAELSFSLRKIWNVRPSAPPPMSAGTERCLAKHFLTDLPGLDELLGRPAPWEAELLKTASASVPGRVRSTARLRRTPV